MEFLENECFGKSSIDRLSGFHLDNDPDVISYRKILAEFFTDRAFRSEPMGSYLAIKEATNQIAGLLLATIYEFTEETDLAKHFRELYVLFRIRKIILFKCNPTKVSFKARQSFLI